MECHQRDGWPRGRRAHGWRRFADAVLRRRRSSCGAACRARAADRGPGATRACAGRRRPPCAPRRVAGPPVCVPVAHTAAWRQTEAHRGGPWHRLPMRTAADTAGGGRGPGRPPPPVPGRWPPHMCPRSIRSGYLFVLPMGLVVQRECHACSPHMTPSHVGRMLDQSRAGRRGRRAAGTPPAVMCNQP